MSLAERQQFIIEGFPNISATLAQRLLSHFGSVRAIMNAEPGELCEVKGIGRLTADELVRVLNEKYFGKDDKEKDEK
jgi:Fanconi anemia group M protein